MSWMNPSRHSFPLLDWESKFGKVQVLMRICPNLGCDGPMSMDRSYQLEKSLLVLKRNELMRKEVGLKKQSESLSNCKKNCGCFADNSFVPRVFILSVRTPSRRSCRAMKRAHGAPKSSFGTAYFGLLITGSRNKNCLAQWRGNFLQVCFPPS